MGRRSKPVIKSGSTIAARTTQQNAYIELYNRTVRHERLNQHLFESIAHTLETSTQWLWPYNNERPNMAIGGITSIQKLKQAA